MRCERSAGADFGGRRAGDEAEWSFPFERAGRSGADYVCRRKHSQAHWARADFRDLPGAPIVRARARRPDVQAEVQASRVESSGEKFADRESRDYGAESWFRGGSGVTAIERSRNHAREFE